MRRFTDMLKNLTLLMIFLLSFAARSANYNPEANNVNPPPTNDSDKSSAKVNVSIVPVFEKSETTIDVNKLMIPAKYDPLQVYEYQIQYYEKKANSEDLEKLYKNDGFVVKDKASVDHTATYEKRVNYNGFINTPGQQIPHNIKPPKFNFTVVNNVSPKPATNDPFQGSYLKKLRYEINAEKQRVQLEDAKNGPLKTVVRKFAPEALTFFLAGGMLYLKDLNELTGGDPEAMLKHIESQKDPIAQLSFGVFMVVNRVTMDLGQKHWVSKYAREEQKRKISVLSKMAMASGAFGSAVFSDVAVLMKECTGSWIKNNIDEKYKVDEKSQAACDATWEQYTARGKFNQYSSSILSLISTITLIQKAEDGASKVINTVSDKVKIKEKILSGEKKVLKFVKINSADVKLAFRSGGLGGLVVQGVIWSGAYLNFTIFLDVEHIVTPRTNRFFNNLILPSEFLWAQGFLNSNLKIANDNKWDFSDKNNILNKAFEEAKSLNWIFDADFVSGISRFTKQMTEWRANLNGSAEADLSAWTALTTKLFNQRDYGNIFYSNYLESLFETINFQANIQNGKYKVQPNEIKNISHYYPFRTLPLYGVKTGEVYAGTPENDLYLTKPFLIEPKQSEFVIKTATDLLTKLDESYEFEHIWPVPPSTLKLTESQKKIASDFLRKLTNPDIAKQGAAFQELNNYISKSDPKFIDFYYVKTHAYEGYKNKDQTNLAFISYLKKLRLNFGDPKPILYQGASFSGAVEIKENYKAISESADFQRAGLLSKLQLTTSADFLTYSMACGLETAKINSEQSVLDSVTIGINFLPPKIISGPRPEKFCSQFEFNSADLYITPIEYQGKKYPNITHFLYYNIKPEILGDWNSSTEKGKNFVTWWENQVAPEMNKNLIKLDQSYKILVEKTFNQIFGRRVGLSGLIDRGLDLFNIGALFGSIHDKNIEDNLYFELEVYLKLLESVNLEKSSSETLTLNSIHKLAVANKYQTVDFDELKVTQTLLEKYKDIVSLAEANVEEITNLDDFEDEVFKKSLQTLKNVIESEGITEEIKNNIALIEPQISLLHDEVANLRLLQLRFVMKKFISILKQDKITSEDLKTISDEVLRTNVALFSSIEEQKKAVSVADLPVNYQLVDSIYNGLKSLQAEVSRYASMKISIVDHFNTKADDLNDLMKEVTKAKSKAVPSSPLLIR